MNRKWLGIGLLVALLVFAGCMQMFTDIPEDQLCEEREYDWDTRANATYTISADANYEAVYNVSGTDELELYRPTYYGSDHALDIESVQFLSADGTHYDCEDIDVETTRSSTVIELPDDEGQFAYHADSTPKRFTTAAHIDGSAEVILPEDREMRIPFVGSARPGGHEIDEIDNQLYIYWDDADSSTIAVHYYMTRDIYIFGTLLIVGGALTSVGLVHYYRQLKVLRERRREYGLDIDEDDEFDRGPPPGMR